MFKRLDRSRLLSGLLDRSSDFLARRAGVPVVVGILLVIVGLVLQIIGLIAPSTALMLLGTIVNGVGTLTALIGLLLKTPLGN